MVVGAVVFMKSSNIHWVTVKVFTSLVLRFLGDVVFSKYHNVGVLYRAI